MTIADFVKTVDEKTPEKILVQASLKELESFSGKLRVAAQLLFVLIDSNVEEIIATDKTLILTLSKNGKVYQLDYCKYGVTLAEMIPPEPLTLPN